MLIDVKVEAAAPAAVAQTDSLLLELMSALLKIHCSG